MAKNYDESDGVWRTIGGRRVFIRKGQSLSDAMIESGKFSRVQKNKDKYENTNEKSTYVDSEIADLDAKHINKQQLEWSKQAKELEENIKKNGSSIREAELKAKQDAVNKSFEENQRQLLEANKSAGQQTADLIKENNIKTFGDEIEEKERLDIAKDIAKEVYGINENNASPERIEKEARKILEYSDGEVLEKGDTPFTNSNGQLERSTKSLEEWRDSLKGNKDEVVKLPDGTPIDQNYVKDLYSGMSYEEVKRANDFDKEWMDKVKPEARPMQTAKVRETEKYLANMERYESRIDDKEYSKKDWGEGVYPFSEGTAWKGSKSGQNLSTTEIAKEVTDKMKEAYPGVTISRKTSYYSGGSSADFSIMSSDKPLIRSIDDFSETELNRLYNKGYNSNHYKDVGEFKEALSKRLSSGNIDINKYHIDDNYELTPYGKAVIKDLKKVTDAYNYDESDGMTDYFNTGFYSDISIGKYNKPYQVKETKKDTSYDPFKGTPYERKYASVDEAIKDPNSKMNNYIRQKAFQKYKKEHPNTKKTLQDFM